MTSSEAAVYLGYTLRSFYKITRKIPHRKERGVLYFKVSDLRVFAESLSVEYTPATEPAA